MWKVADIIMIPKLTRATQEVTSYMPILLFPVISKLLFSSSFFSWIDRFTSRAGICSRQPSRLLGHGSLSIIWFGSSSMSLPANVQPARSKLGRPLFAPLSPRNCYSELKRRVPEGSLLGPVLYTISSIIINYSYFCLSYHNSSCWI